jgi:hypothetical protein
MSRVAAVALLLVLAGCSGLGGPTPPDQSTATTAPTTMTSETSTATEATTTVPELNRIDYSELSPAQQRAFDQAVGDEARFVRGLGAQSPYLDESYFAETAATPFKTHDYVCKDGVLYELEYSDTLGPLIASYYFQATESQPTENQTVVDFEAIPTRAKNPVRSAIENGSYQVPPGKWSSRPELGSRFVRYNGTVYEISIAVGDSWAETLRAERVG